MCSSDLDVVVFHCFYLHFLDDIQCGSSFPMLICHLYIFFDELSVKVSGPFMFLLLSFKSSLYILVLYQMCLISVLQIFSPSLWLIFSFS